MESLRVEDLINVSRPFILIPWSVRRCKADIIDYLQSHGSQELLAVLSECANNRVLQLQQAKENKRHQVNARAAECRKAKREDAKRTRTEWDMAKFLDLPSDVELHNIYRHMFDATSTAESLKLLYCAVCGRERDHLDPKNCYTRILLGDLPNTHRLIPQRPHPAQQLTNGILLAHAGTHQKGDETYRGLRGNVSSYALDSPGIVSMLEGNLMPRRPAILVSVLSITFIGKGKIPKNWIKQLKNAIYSEMTYVIREHMSELPNEDDVPQEIWRCIRHEHDEGVLDEEDGGYIPRDEDIMSNDDDEQSKKEGDDSSQGKPDENKYSFLMEAIEPPTVIPYELSGSLDCNLQNITTSELMQWGLKNMLNDEEDVDEKGYFIRHSGKPVSDFGRVPRMEGITRFDTQPHFDAKNYFEQAFPVLYPYGTGGIECRLYQMLSFIEHIRWSLRQPDRQFRKHHTFMFVAFGILQCRQALGSARLQMLQQNYEENVELISGMTDGRLKWAQCEEEAGKPISNLGVRQLLQQVRATSGRIIWATCITIRPPVLWLTINPSDLHDPIAQIFAGEDLDIEKVMEFAQLHSPDKDVRAQNVAQDPYAAAKFFHFIIRAILHKLFGFDVTPYKTTTTMGIFGRACAYFGTVESQGRGMLHFHLLLFLWHALSASEIKEFLKSDSFRAKVVRFIRTHLRSYLPELQSKESAAKVDKEADVAFTCHPPHPDDPNFYEALQSLELRAARNKQIHTCDIQRCLQMDKAGRLWCKRRAPFRLSDDDFIDENGNWGSKRTYAYVNGWVPSILIWTRSNNDGKLLTNGADTKNITFYITSYLAKQQKDKSNITAVACKTFAFHEQMIAQNEGDDIRDQHRKLLFRLSHALNSKQVLSGPMVVSYLMGWGDVYCSHQYTPIYWSVFVRELLKTFPELRR
ncbi:hypothetical protein FISHEDRAFT_63402 [Fistulina hepatica ATCC 64428]|uniref:Helitron helicase-like domain-containing protein n=1 Tax=Fistulina hepatica ATCC 64428 TaxID=1128425 RepID=A0A0D7APU5_9AGAR|nr:hypothetical protein FISHEDRAFT_63402 [Fistulina hepatica ATCC 64428]